MARALEREATELLLPAVLRVPFTEAARVGDIRHVASRPRSGSLAAASAVTLKRAIASIEADSGARLTIRLTSSGDADALIVRGAEDAVEEAIAQARAFLRRLEARRRERTVVDMDVGSSDRELTNAAVRAIVGAGGETIRSLEAQSGAAIAVERSGSARIEAPDATSAECARETILKVVEPMLRQGTGTRAGGRRGRNDDRGGSGGGIGKDVSGSGDGKLQDEVDAPRPKAPPPELVPGMDPAKQAAMKRNAKRRDAKRARKQQQQQQQQRAQQEQQEQQEHKQQQPHDSDVSENTLAHTAHRHEDGSARGEEQPHHDDEESWLQSELAAAGLRFGAAAENEMPAADLDDMQVSASTGKSPSMLSASSEVYDEMSGSMSRTVLDLLGLGVQRGSTS